MQCQSISAAAAQRESPAGRGPALIRQHRASSHGADDPIGSAASKHAIKTQRVCPFERIREAKVLATMNAKAVEVVGVTNAAKHSHHETVHEAAGMDDGRSLRKVCVSKSVSTPADEPCVRFGCRAPGSSPPVCRGDSCAPTPPTHRE